MDELGAGLLLEGLVAGLLMVTLGYCVMLNHRLKRLRADESSLREMFEDLVRATDIAERAVAGLKQTAADCDRDLTGKLRQADRFCRAIDRHLQAGDTVLERLSRIAILARDHGIVAGSGAPEYPAAREAGAAVGLASVSERAA